MTGEGTRADRSPRAPVPPASWSVAAGFQGVPGLQLPNHDLPDFQVRFAESIAENIISGWMSLFAGLLAGFGPSYFFCAVTVIYFLLRKSDDGTGFSQVAIYDEPGSDAGNTGTDTVSQTPDQAGSQSVSEPADTADVEAGSRN